MAISFLHTAGRVFLLEEGDNRCPANLLEKSVCRIFPAILSSNCSGSQTFACLPVCFLALNIPRNPPHKRSFKVKQSLWHIKKGPAASKLQGLRAGGWLYAQLYQIASRFLGRSLYVTHCMSTYCIQHCSIYSGGL